jgi:uncharacterized protein (DUF2252 family)
VDFLLSISTTLQLSSGGCIEYLFVTNTSIVRMEGQNEHYSFSSHHDEEYDPLLHDGKGETLRLLTNTTGIGDYGGWPQPQLQQSRRRRMDPLLIRDDDQWVHGVTKHQVSCTQVRFVCALFVVVVASASVVLLNHSSISAFGMSLTATTTTNMELPHLWGKKHTKDEEKSHDDPHGNRVVKISQWMPPEAISRCEWVMDQFHQRDLGSPPDDLRQRYLAQSVDLNIFYRATAHLFWQDFGKGAWGANLTGSFLLDDDTVEDDNSHSTSTAMRLNGAPLVYKNLWTWITGDQHLSNFGAWLNRHGDIVFGVNDFDEAAIFDFQIDILRIAVSIGSHAITNGFSKRQVNRALDLFAMNYINTVLEYVDNEDALLFELTPDTATSSDLKEFLQKTRDKNSSGKQMTKFTVKAPTHGGRHFIKGPVNTPHPDTALASVPQKVEEQLRREFTRNKYGASMMKLGWAVMPWNDDYFTVLDIAERVGSGIGSFGVDRYYVLLKGHDGLLLGDGDDGKAVILDVKYQPPSAVSRVLTEEEAAWYHDLFPNEAARVVEAQRRLTSYTDPYTGWITITTPLPSNDTTSPPLYYERPYTVRQRSPWKNSPDFDTLTNADDFYEFMIEIAKSTATSHVRGSVAKAPAEFKHVIATVLAKKDKQQEWSKLVTRVAHAYRAQVELDFICFRDYVHDKYSS